MELCLYHPQYGYYMRPGRKTGYGRDADFVTPPTLHSFLGRAVAGELYDAWRKCNAPDLWTVHELGGGEGDLARHALAWLDQTQPEFASIIRWRHIEASPEHRRRMSSQDPRITVADATWNGNVGFFAHALERPDTLLACEVLDAMKSDILQFAGWRSEADEPGSWEEVRVGTLGERFVEKLVPARPRPYFWKQAWPGRDPIIGQRVADQWAALMLLEDIVFQGGPGKPVPKCAILIDYGDVRRRLWTPDRLDGSVRGFRNHALAPSVLENPGEIDITVSVDFTSAAEAFDIHYSTNGPESLEAFLLRHGILEELNRIDRNTVEGASSYLRLRQLLLPTGMGAAFKVQRFDRVPSGTSARRDST